MYLASPKQMKRFGPDRDDAAGKVAASDAIKV